MAWHVADTESRCYLPRLGLAGRPREADLLGELQRWAAHVQAAVQGVAAALLRRSDGEVWTTTKLLRRLAWHERGELVVMRRLAWVGDHRLGRRAAGQLEHAGLSRRELEVLRLVSVGRTNREIARELFLSPRTIDMHVRNVLTKLGCRSRTEATRRAVELGLLESQP
jgi:DNA-binding NarL/FixJ family response regulator